jgi:hypothetical protein
MVDRCQEALIGGFRVAESILIHKADIANVDDVFDGDILKKFGSFGKYFFPMKKNTFFLNSLRLFILGFRE